MNHKMLSVTLWLILTFFSCLPISANNFGNRGNSGTHFGPRIPDVDGENDDAGRPSEELLPVEVRQGEKKTCFELYWAKD